jgi:hypothetical protein
MQTPRSYLHASCVGTSWPPFFNQPGATSRQLAGMLSRAGAHELRWHLAASGPRLGPLGSHFPPAQQPAGTPSRADNVMLALITMRPRSPTRRTPRQLTGSLVRRRTLLFALHARRTSTCIAFCMRARRTSTCIALRMHARRTLLCPMVPNHTQITASNGIQPYAVRSSVHGFSHMLSEPSPSVWGELCCMRRRLLLFGNAAGSPSQCFGPKSPPGFCPNPHSCCVHTTH